MLRLSWSWSRWYWSWSPAAKCLLLKTKPESHHVNILLVLFFHCPSLSSPKLLIQLWRELFCPVRLAAGVCIVISSPWHLTACPGVISTFSESSKVSSSQLVPECNDTEVSFHGSQTPCCLSPPGRQEATVCSAVSGLFCILTHVDRNWRERRRKERRNRRRDVQPRICDAFLVLLLFFFFACSFHVWCRVRVSDLLLTSSALLQYLTSAS